MSPPPVPDQRAADAEHVRLLVIFHYVFAGLGGLGLLFLGGHAIVMFTLFFDGQGSGPPPRDLLLYLPVLYGAAALLVLGASLLNFLSARWMKQRKNRTFSLIVAGLNCLQIPLGLVLGIFTFIVLCRPAVMEEYRSAHS
jgi:anaerobic C4-dicarboxylate transporter